MILSYQTLAPNYLNLFTNRADKLRNFYVKSKLSDRPIAQKLIDIDHVLKVLNP